MASLSEISSLLSNHVVEIKFIRRRPKPGASSTRRALITTNLALLNSPRGKVTLRYTGPGGGMSSLGFNPADKNLVLAWDLMWQEYRLFGAENSTIITKIPVSTTEEADKFWEYFDENILPMSPENKLGFMNS